MSANKGKDERKYNKLVNYISCQKVIGAIEKRKSGEGWENWEYRGGTQVAVLNRMVRVGFVEKERLKDVWGGVFQGERKASTKALRQGQQVRSETARRPVAGVKQERQGEGHGLGEGTLCRSLQAIVGCME